MLNPHARKQRSSPRCLRDAWLERLTLCRPVQAASFLEDMTTASAISSCLCKTLTPGWQSINTDAKTLLSITDVSRWVQRVPSARDCHTAQVVCHPLPAFCLASTLVRTLTAVVRPVVLAVRIVAAQIKQPPAPR